VELPLRLALRKRLIGYLNLSLSLSCSFPFSGTEEEKEEEEKEVTRAEEHARGSTRSFLSSENGECGRDGMRLARKLVR